MASYFFRARQLAARNISGFHRVPSIDNATADGDPELCRCSGIDVKRHQAITSSEPLGFAAPVKRVLRAAAYSLVGSSCATSTRFDRRDGNLSSVGYCDLSSTRSNIRCQPLWRFSVTGTGLPVACNAISPRKFANKVSDINRLNRAGAVASSEQWWIGWRCR
jgi:hypothetical protein